MNTVLIHAADEYTRDTIKSALIDHCPLIITEDRVQCLEAIKQKAAIHKAFIGVSGKTTATLKLFEEISALKSGLNMTAVGDHNTEEMAAEAVRHGAAGYILIPCEANAILTLARPRVKQRPPA